MEQPDPNSKNETNICFWRENLMKKMRLGALLMAGALLTASLAGCGNKAGGNESGTEGGEIVIGGLAPLTGGVAQYGLAVNNAVQLAVRDINAKGGILGKQIKYVFYDEKGDATEATNAYSRLVDQDKIVALIGDVTSVPCEAVAQQAARDKMPMITPSGTTEAITTYGENVFRACFIDPYQGQLMADYAAKKLDAKTAAILYDTGDSYSSGIADAFEEAAKKLNITITNKEGYASKSTDFNTQLDKIKSSNPDVLLLPVYYNDVVLIAKQAKDKGLTSTLLGADGWDGVAAQLDGTNADVVKNAYFCSQYSASSTDEALQKFLKTYKDTYNEDPSMFAVLGYDSMMIMAAAIEKAGSTDSDAIIAALKETNYKGLTGTTSFDDKRNPVREAIITSFDGLNYKVVESYSMG